MTSAKPKPPLIPGETRAYPVLPLRDIVVFPHMIVPLFVGREKSIKALEEVMRSDTFILLATQKNASDDDPATAAIYEIGTLASVLQLLKLPDGTVKVLVEGAARAKVERYTDRAEYYEADAVVLADSSGEQVEAEALARSVINEFESYVKLNKKVSPEVVGVVQQIEDYAKLADTVASADIGDICLSFLSSCVAFSRASFDSLVRLILSSISASSSLPSSSPSSFWIAFICSLR